MKSRLVLALCTCCVFTAVLAAPALADFDNPPVSLSVSTSGGGTVVGGVNGSGIDCGAACSLEDQPGTDSEYVGIGNGNCGNGDRLMCTAVYHDVTLTAQPHLGWEFAGWGGQCGGTNPTCSFTLSGDRSVSASFTDVAPPTVGITGPSGNAGGTFTLSASAWDNDAINRVQFLVNDVNAGADNTAPYSVDVDSTKLSEGSAKLTAIAIDAAGHTASTTSTVTIDNLKPTLAFSAGPDGGTFGLGTTHTWTFAAADAGSGVQKVECKLDAAAYGACSGGNGSHTVSGLADGVHTLSVKVTDKAGRSDSFSRTVKIDGVAPQTTITGGRADGSASTDTTASFTFAADQAGSTFKCRVYPAALTPGDFGPCTGAAAHTASGFAPGTYAFEVVATDPYGNVDGTPAKRTFTVTAKPTDDKPAGGGGKPSTGGGGGQTTGGGRGGSAPAGGGSEPAGGKIDAKLNTFWKLYGKRTKVQTLTVSNAPAGSKVTISCKGKGCKFRKVSSTLSGTKLKLAVRFRGKKLPARTVITVTITKEGWVGKTFKYVTRAGKFPKLSLS
jgi:Bacterial Ig domain/Divergent InlB B-repeat domain